MSSRTRKTEQRVTVYRRDGKLIFATSNRSSGRYALWIDSGPMRVLNETDPHGRVGEAVVAGLEESRSGVAFPLDLDGSEKPLLEATGLASWSDFKKGAVSCHVERDESGFRFVPSSSERGGFVPRKHEHLHVEADATPEQLGKALVDVLGKSD
jgi:hypothetical protein